MYTACSVNYIGNKITLPMTTVKKQDLAHLLAERIMNTLFWGFCVDTLVICDTSSTVFLLNGSL